MPNHVINVVRFKNLKPTDINIILDMIATPMYEPALVIEDNDYAIDFNKIIPEPEFESECPEEYKVNKSSRIELLKDKPWFDWYRWRINNWHTKWGAYSCHTKIGKTYIEFVFRTAWSFAYPVIQKLALLGYDIDIKYADEDYGNNCGKLTYRVNSGWDIWNEDDLDNPEQFARNLWNKY